MEGRFPTPQTANCSLMKMNSGRVSLVVLSTDDSIQYSWKSFPDELKSIGNGHIQENNSLVKYLLWFKSQIYNICQESSKSSEIGVLYFKSANLQMAPQKSVTTQVSIISSLNTGDLKQTTTVLIQEYFL